MTKRDPFKYFRNSPEIIRLAAMLYVRFPLSLRNVEDLLHERGIEVSQETLRYWWNRFGPLFAAEAYGAAMKVIGNADRQETGRWKNNRAENSHLRIRRRKRAMHRFRRMRSLQKFFSVHASIFNHFNQERHRYARDNFKLNRTSALSEWRDLGKA